MITRLSPLQHPNTTKSVKWMTSSGLILPTKKLALQIEETENEYQQKISELERELALQQSSQNVDSETVGRTLLDAANGTDGNDSAYEPQDGSNAVRAEPNQQPEASDSQEETVTVSKDKLLRTLAGFVQTGRELKQERDVIVGVNHELVKCNHELVKEHGVVVDAFNETSYKLRGLIRLTASTFGLDLGRCGESDEQEQPRLDDAITVHSEEIE